MMPKTSPISQASRRTCTVAPRCCVSVPNFFFEIKLVSRTKFNGWSSSPMHEEDVRPGCFQSGRKPIRSEILFQSVSAAETLACSRGDRNASIGAAHPAIRPRQTARQPQTAPGMTVAGTPQAMPDRLKLLWPARRRSHGKMEIARFQSQIRGLYCLLLDRLHGLYY